MKAMVSPIWAALGDAPGSMVSGHRVRHSVVWLLAYFRRQRGTIARSYRHDDAAAAGQLVIEVDAKGAAWI